jgi:two-component system response regulator DesR
LSIRVIVAEDQAMVRGALAALLETENDIEEVAQAQDGKQALDLVISHRPEVLLTDIEMREITGIELAAEIQRRNLP